MAAATVAHSFLGGHQTAGVVDLTCCNAIGDRETCGDVRRQSVWDEYSVRDNI
jgi:hypothetical protein